MKFRGKITDIICIRQFTQLVCNVSRLSKECVLRLTPDRLCLVVSEGGAMGLTPGLWAELEQQHYFTDYTMEGVSQEDNMIYLELHTDKLAKILNSLRTTQSAKCLKIKLTKKHSPCLTFEVELPSLSDRGRVVVHDLPVTLIPRRLWGIHKEPCMSEDSLQVSIYLPPLKHLRHVVDRMKSVSSHLTLAASRAGALVLSVANDSVQVTTRYENLVNPAFEGGSSKDAPLDTMHSVKVDIKKFASFVQSDPSPNSTVICNMVAGRVLHLFLLQDNITLQYYLPAIVDHR